MAPSRPKIPFEDLPLPEQYKAWREVNRWEAWKIQREIRRDGRHRRRMEYLPLVLTPHCLGFLAVVIAAGVSIVFLFHGQSTQGAWIFGSAASLASVFVGGKYVASRRNPPQSERISILPTGPGPLADASPGDPIG